MDIEKLRPILESRTSINSETGCWEYLGINGAGYGQITIDRKFYYVHVLSAMMFLSYIPAQGLMICHKDDVCRSRACWNPEHLYIGDAWENNQDIMKTGNYKGRYSDVTHCVNGHEFTPANTYNVRRLGTGKMRRQCRLCKRMRSMKTNKLRLAK